MPTTVKSTRSKRATAIKTTNAEPKAEPEVSAVTMDTGIKPPPPPPKQVKIRAREAHSCVIGGTRYTFAKGEAYTVPENVRAVLAKADLLLPL